MRIDKHTPLADLILRYPLLLPVLARFSISLGVGEATIGEVCHQKSIQLDFFLEIVRSYTEPEHRTEAGLNDFPILLIVDYLRHSHYEYKNVRLPRIEADIQHLVNNCLPENKSKLLRLSDYFEAYRQALSEHFRLEDEGLFPYAESLEQAVNTRSNPVVPSPSVQQVLENQHEHLEYTLTDLKNIIIRYLPPVRDQHACLTILHELFEMEKDLNDHSRIEDLVLMPRIKKYERLLAKQ